MFLGSKPVNLLKVLINQGKVKASEVSKWQHLSNLEVEKELRKEGTVSSVDIAKAYAVAYSLPFVSLSEKRVEKDVLGIIPEQVAKELKIVAYELDYQTFSGKVLHIATAAPGGLSEHVRSKIRELQKKKGIKIELAVTPLEDFGLVLSQYSIKDLPKVEQEKEPEGNDKIEKTKIDAKADHKTIDLKKIVIPYDTISKFPEEISRKYKMVVFEAPTSSSIKVAITDPEDPKVQELLNFVKEKNNISIEIYVAEGEDIFDALRYYNNRFNAQIEFVKEEPPPKPPEKKPELAINQHPKQEFTSTKPVQDQVPEITGGKAAKPLVMPENNLDTFLGGPLKSIDELETIANGDNIPKIVAAVVALASFKKASDIHIEPTDRNLRVRYRVDGILKDIIKLPIEMHPAIVSRIKILSNLKIDENRVPQDGRFDVITNGHAIDFRVSSLPTVHGEKIALRILDKSARIYTFEELGLVGHNLKILMENIDKPYGTILSTGPTGSGKSTTLYAILSRISTASVNIVTLEDPVEYEIGGINQCQIKPKIGFTFANGLRSILRQDPNIIMVGEIRDSETASLAIHAALTGHLVLSSLHTNDAPGALLRLINMGIEPFLITSSVNVVVAQRLVRKLCPKCKMPAHIPDPILKTIQTELEKFKLPQPYQFFEGRGCDQCEQGYKGRIGIFEVMPITEEIEGLAAARKQSSELRSAAIRNGMITMKQDGLIKALNGLTTVNEVLRVISI